MDKKIKSFIIIMVVGIVVVGIHFIPNMKPVEKLEVVYLSGKIISNNKLEGSDQYLNVIELENGEFWTFKSYEQRVNKDVMQTISMGRYKDYNGTTILKIEPTIE